MPQSKYSTVLQNYAKSQKNAEKDGGDNNGSPIRMPTRTISIFWGPQKKTGNSQTLPIRNKDTNNTYLQLSGWNDMS